MYYIVVFGTVMCQFDGACVIHIYIRICHVWYVRHKNICWFYLPLSLSLSFFFVFFLSFFLLLFFIFVFFPFSLFSLLFFSFLFFSFSLSLISNKWLALDINEYYVYPFSNTLPMSLMSFHCSINMSGLFCLISLYMWVLLCDATIHVVCVDVVTQRTVFRPYKLKSVVLNALQTALDRQVQHFLVCQNVIWCDAMWCETVQCWVYVWVMWYDTAQC